MFTLSALLFDNGLPNLPVLLIEPVCTENFIRVDDAPESPKLAE